MWCSMGTISIGSRMNGMNIVEAHRVVYAFRYWTACGCWSIQHNGNNDGAIHSCWCTLSVEFFSRVSRIQFWFVMSRKANLDAHQWEWKRPRRLFIPFNLTANAIVWEIIQHDRPCDNSNENLFAFHQHNSFKQIKSSPVFTEETRIDPSNIASHLFCRRERKWTTKTRSVIHRKIQVIEYFGRLLTLFASRKSSSCFLTRVVLICITIAIYAMRSPYLSRLDWMFVRILYLFILHH